MKNLKKALCLFLVLVMCLGMLPVSVLAAEAESDPKQIVTAAGEGTEEATKEEPAKQEEPAEQEVTPSYATVDELNAAFEAYGETDDVDGGIAALENVLKVFDALSPDDQEAMAEYKAGAEDQMETLLAAKEAEEKGEEYEDPEIETLAGATYTFTIKSYVYDGRNWNLETLTSRKKSATLDGWSWSPSGNNYKVTQTFSSGNAHDNRNFAMYHPSQLWEYDTSSYEFLGWSKTGATLKPEYATFAGNSKSGYNVSTKSATYYIILKAKPTYTYTLNYKGNEPYGTATNVPGTQASGNITTTTWSPTVSTTVPELTGYTFDGWYLNSNGTGTKYVGGNTVSGYSTTATSKTLYAKWTPNTYTITYKDGVEGQEVFADQVKSAKYGENTPTYTAPETYTDSNGKVWEFNGWDKEIAATVTGNATYTAKWKEKVTDKPVLTITKKADKTTANVGDTLTYTITVTNNGKANATNVTVTDILPDGLKLDADSMGNGTYWPSTRKILWELGPLAANGGTATVQFEAEVTATGSISNTATVDSDETDPKDSEPADVTATNTPKLTIAKKADKTTANVGDIITYTITVKNMGKVTATNVTVTDKLDSKLEWQSAGHSWTAPGEPLPGYDVTSNESGTGIYGTQPAEGVYELPDMKPGMELTLTITAKATEAGEVKNTATVKGNDVSEQPSNEVKVTVTAPVVDDGKGVSITKTRVSINGNSELIGAKVGDQIVWNIVVKNNSNVEKTVTLTEELTGAELSKDSVTLAAGKSETVTATYTVTGDEALENGKFYNTVKGTTNGTGDKENPTAKDDGTEPGNHVPDNPDGNVTMTKTVDNPNPKPGDVVEFTITVTNNTNRTLDFAYADILPEGLSYAYPNLQLPWSYPIKAGETKTVGYNAVVGADVPVGTKLTNKATVTAEGKSYSDTATVTVTDPNAPVTPETPDLTVQKLALVSGTVKPGDEVKYMITVTNTGKTDVTGVVIVDELNEYLKFVSASGTGKSWDSAPANGRYEFDKTLIAGDNSNNKVTLTIIATVKADAPNGTTISNTAYAKCDGLTNPESSNKVDVTVKDPTKTDWSKLTVTKTANPATAKAGDEIVYTITVKNETGKDLKDIKVVEKLPEQVTLKGNAPDGYTNGVWTITSLKNGDTATLELTVTVNEGVVNTTITNKATVTDAKTDETTPEELPDDTKPEGKVDVTVPDNEPGPGITYTVTYVLNGGTSNAQLVYPGLEAGTATPTIADPTRSGYTFAGWSPEVAATVTGNATYTAQWTSIGGGGNGGGGTNIPDTNPPTTDPGTDIGDENPPLANVDDKLNTTDHFAYIIGYPEGDVRPNANITRAEAVTIFFRLMTDEFRAANWSSENAYPDVESGDWFNNAISTLTKAGIFKGDETGNARPNDAITRAEFAALAARFMSDEIVDDGARFEDTEGHWAAADIRRAMLAGWIKGVGGNKFEPDRNITRAEVMTLVNRMLDRVADKDHMLSDMKVWSDNMDTSAWYYADVQEATNGHDYKRLEGELTEQWTALQEARDWAALETEWATAESGK